MLQKKTIEEIPDCSMYSPVTGFLVHNIYLLRQVILTRGEVQKGHPSSPKKPTKPPTITRFSIGCLLDILGIIVLVTALIFPFHFFLPAWSRTETTVTIEPYRNAQIDHDFFMGGVVRGTITHTMETNSTVTLSFYIEDSTGEKVVDPRRIPGTYNFELQPQQTGLHRLVLDNTLQMQGTARLTIQQYYYNILFLSLGFVIFIAGILLIVTAPEHVTS
jgi:hypothetical protein